MAEIGDTLREARMKARIDVSELEAKTKIRAKYLRALENEEWSLLPGSTFVKSFLRTYAQALGLDGKALVEEYRLQFELPSETAPEPPSVSRYRTRMRMSAPRLGVPTPRWSVPGASRGYVIAVGAVTVLIIVLIVALATSGGSSKSPSASTKSKHHLHRYGAATHPAVPAPIRVSLSLHATARVYICLIGEGGRRLLSGVILQAGESTPVFHAKRFVVTLGNSGVTMFVDGLKRPVPESSEAIGYTITKAGRRLLAAGQLPTCA
jgi:hypothetical protein